MKTYLVDFGWGKTGKVRSLKEARADKWAIGVHEYIDGKLFRSIYFVR